MRRGDAAVPATQGGGARALEQKVETDTLYIEFRSGEVDETRDLDEDTLLDVDASGNVLALTLEHASERAGIPEFSYQQVAA